MTREYEVRRDSTAVMRSRGREYPLRAVKTRTSFSCGECGLAIAGGKVAYRESAPRADCYWLAGVKICGRCVEGCGIAVRG